MYLCVRCIDVASFYIVDCFDSVLYFVFHLISNLQFLKDMNFYSKMYICSVTSDLFVNKLSLESHVILYVF